MVHPDLEEADLLLARAAKNAFVRAEHLQQLCLAAESVAEATEASRACDRAERSMRQHLLVLDQFRRRRRADSREQRIRDAGPRRLRAAALEDALRRVICAERAEAAERLALYDELDSLIDPQTAPDDFAERPFHAQVLEFAAALGLSPETAEGWPDLPDAEDIPEPDADPEAHADISRLPHEERCRRLARAGVLIPDTS